MKLTSWLPGAATLIATIACFGMLALAGLLAAFGISLSAGVRGWAGAVCLFAAVAMIGIAVNCERRRVWGPLVPAVAGTALILTDIFAGIGRGAEPLGFALLVLATFWDWRLRLRLPAPGAAELRWIDTEELARRLSRQPRPLVIDVRNPDEFAGELGHMEGARNIPLAELPRRLAELGEDKDRPVAVVCRTDMRSAKAAALLGDNGFRDVAVLRGGMLAWRQAEPSAAEPANAAE